MEKQFCDLYREQRQRLYLYFYRRTKDDELSRDLCQDVYLKFWALKDKYAEIENLTAFLMQMAKNVLFDYCKHKKIGRACLHILRSEIQATERVTQTLFEERELNRKFQQGILQLSKQKKAVFVLAKLEGWPRKKIAKSLGVSELTVKVTMQNAIKEIYDYVGIKRG